MIRYSVSRKWVRFAISLAVVALIFGCSHVPEYPAVSRQDALSLWQGTVRDTLVDFVFDVSTPGHRDFIPVRDRIAVFDMDGTLISERPLFFMMEVLIQYLREHGDELSRKGPEMKALCSAARTGDIAYLGKDLNTSLVLPFEGKTYDFFREYCLRVFETALNGAKGRPHKELVYQPMIELIDLLHTRGFTVYIVSGSFQFAIMAISEKYLHVDESRCMGSMVRAFPERIGKDMVFIRGGFRPPVNLGSAKAVRIKMRTGRTPVLAFGNSSGDAWMLDFAASSPYRHLACLVDHDDPREFVYRKEEFLQAAKNKGWLIVSMKNNFKTIFGDSR